MTSPSKDDLARIVERDAEWIEQDGRLVLTWRNVRSGEQRIAPNATDPEGPADRRVLLDLLRETHEALRGAYDLVMLLAFAPPEAEEGVPKVFAFTDQSAPLLARLAALDEEKPQ